MIHINVARKIVNSKQPFSCLVWTLKGEVLQYNDVVCTSSFFEGNTFNVKFIGSREIRTVKVITMFEINNEEIFI